MITLENKTVARLVLLAAMACLGGCGLFGQTAKPVYPTVEGRDENGTNDIYSQPQTVFDSPDKHSHGLHLFGHDDAQNNAPGIDVNSFLWRASLDTVSFMPLASADPFGGTILTDWYAAPQTPNERYKLNVLILGRQLRSDGVKVKVFRQVRAHNGGWQDASVPAGMGDKIEDSILTRARQLRIAQAGQ